MPNVLFLLPDLGYSGAAKQVSLLAPGLRRAGWTAEVFSLAGGGPFAPILRGADVPVLTSTARHALKWLGLRWLVPSSDRGVVHAFGLPVLRRLWVGTLGSDRPKVVVSLSGRERLTWFDRRCLRLASHLVVPHATAADALLRQGVSAPRITVVPPAVGEATPPPDRAAFCRSLGIPADAPLVVSVGRMDGRKALLGAIWAFEFVRYTDPAVRLLLVGDGPGRAQMEELTRGLAPEGSRAVFLGARPDAAGIVGLADVVVAAHPAGGANAALEAMAAGRAVLAVNTPDLAPLIRDGETGVLVRPDYRPGIASALRKLLLDPARRRLLGDAARDYVREHHPVDTLVRTMEAVSRE
ncbi:MAG TPA: glycosyltransferase family 4 protein [Gemmataceae bacterium]|nr:glycosyltransferase family 4 protein [Gemmataceae bacterium]